MKYLQRLMNKNTTSCLAINGFIISVFFTVAWSSVSAENLLDPVNGGEFTYIDSEANNTSRAASNLVDNNFSSYWESPNFKFSNDFIFKFGPDSPLKCFDEFSVTGVNNSTGLETFMLLTTSDLSLDQDNGTTGWIPVVADANPAGVINHMHWGQGGRLVSGPGSSPSSLNDGSPGRGWSSSNFVFDNSLEFAFDSDWNDSIGDAVRISELQLYNNGDSTGVEKFQVEVKTVANPNWTRLIADANPAGDFNYLQSSEGGVITASVGSSANQIHDATPGVGWSSVNFSFDNALDFAFDTDADGLTSAAGDVDDLFTLRQINLYNNGDSTGVEKFQVEVKTVANPNWTKLIADTTPPGDFNFLQSSEGGVITASVGSSPDRIHDGTPGVGWTSANFNYENVLDFNFDTDDDGLTSAAGDVDDLFTLRQINLYNNGDSTGVEKFQVEVKTTSNPNWTRVIADATPSGDFNFLQSSEGGVITASVGVDVDRIHDGTPGVGWTSANFSSDNVLDFAFDTDADGTTSSAGDTDDLFALRQINLYNNGDSTGVQDFQIEVKTVANPIWTLVLFSGNTTITAQRNWNLQSFVPDTPIIDVTDVRLHTLNNYGHSLTRIREFEVIGDPIGVSHTFTALRHWNEQAYVLDVPVVDITDLRLRTLDNYGHSLTRIREFEAIGDAVGASHTFVAQRHWNEQAYVLDVPVVDVTDVRLRTLDNYGHSLTRIREFEAIGDAVGESHTFVAQRHWNEQSYVLDVPVVDVTDFRLRTLDNYGHSLTRIREFEAIGDAVGPSHTFVAQRHWNLQSYTLDVAVENVTDVRFRSLDNYGHSLTRVREFGVAGITNGPAYVFTSQRSDALQSYNIDGGSGRLFRFHTFDNYGHSVTRTRAITLESTLCLAGYWPMDEVSWNGTNNEVADISGNDIHGTSYSGAKTSFVTSAIPGNPGTCGYGDFDGSNDYVQIPHSPKLNGEGLLTYAAWVRAESWGGLRQIMAKSVHGGGSGRGQMGIFSESGVLKGRAETINGRKEITTTLPSTDVWHHIALVFDGTRLDLYVDGSSVANAQFAATSLIATTDPLNISKRVGTSQYFFDGDIDEVRVYQQALDELEIQTVMAEAHPCVSSLDHFLISHDGQGISCALETVGVSAHAVDHTVVSGYSGSIVLNTGTTKGSWSLVAGSGVFQDATFNDGLATYQFDVADGGVAQFSLDYQEGSSPINITVSDSSVLDDDSEGLLSFSPSGFILTASQISNPPPNPINDPVLDQTAGTNFNLWLTAFGQTATDPSCGVIESYAGAKPINFWNNYSNPNSGTITPTIDGVSIAATEIASNPQNVTFNSGQAQVIVKYKDVGRIQLEVKDAELLTKGNVITGATNNFVVKPADFIINPVANPAAVDANGGVFKRAGEAFQVDLSVVDAEGSVTPNYGNENPAETIKIKSSQLVAPIGGRNGADTIGTLINGTAFGISAPGIFTNTTVSFNEVGIIRLQADVGDNDYLGSGNVTGAETGNVGRFIPDRFQLTDNSPAFRDGNNSWSCGFTYQQQPFEFDTGLHPILNITAVNEAGSPTFNYGAAFWKLNTNASNRDYVNQVAGISAVLVTDSSAATVVLSGTADLTDGEAELTINGDQLNYQKAGVIPTPADAPFAADVVLSLSVADLQDSDNVCFDSDNDGNCDSYSSANINGTQIRWGRWSLENIFGSELEALPTVAVAQQFDGAVFQLNSDDSCSSTDASWIVPTLTAYTENLSDGETLLTQAAMAPGFLQMTLSAPGEGNYGSTLITMPTPIWMYYDFDGDGTADAASATATFGIYKGKSPVIYWRQKYGN